MKKIYLGILVFVFISCGTKKLQGIYCHSFNGGDDSTCLTFKKDKTFTYETAGDLGIYWTGKGKYNLEKKILELRFDKDSVIQKSTVTTEDLSFRDDKEADSVGLIFKVYDGFNKGIPFYGATIYEESDNYSYSKENNVNRNGALTLTKAASNKTESYKIGFLGYETVKVDLDHNTTKEIKVTLYPAQPQIISDTTLTYTLKKVEKDSFLTSQDYLYRKVQK